MAPFHPLAGDTVEKLDADRRGNRPRHNRFHLLNCHSRRRSSRKSFAAALASSPRKGKRANSIATRRHSIWEVSVCVWRGFCAAAQLCKDTWPTIWRAWLFNLMGISREEEGFIRFLILSFYLCVRVNERRRELFYNGVIKEKGRNEFLISIVFDQGSPGRGNSSSFIVMFLRCNQFSIRVQFLPVTGRKCGGISERLNFLISFGNLWY